MIVCGHPSFCRRIFLDEIRYMYFMVRVEKYKKVRES
jgi:hypothetical protein